MSAAPPPPQDVAADYPLARLTTIRTGGHGDFFARPASAAKLAELLAWAGAAGVEVGVVGSGSNLLIADDGFRGLVMKLDGSLATIERDGERLLCGGGARLPQAAAFAAREGLSGLEFGVNIPGTVGGAVKMNANAYGGDLARVLEWVEITTASGTERRTPDQLGFSYRRSNLDADRDRRPRLVRAQRGSIPLAVKGTLADMRAARQAAQPSGIKTFGSTFKNPDDPRAEGRSAGVLLDEAGCRGLTVGAARFSEKHANFVENTGEATTADVIALMGEGRRRVQERFGVELEPEVQFLGEVDTAPLWGDAVSARAAVRRGAALRTRPALRSRCRRDAAKPQRLADARWRSRSCSPPATSSGCATPRSWPSRRSRSPASRRRTPRACAPRSRPRPTA